MPRGRNRFSSLWRRGSYGSSSRTTMSGYENEEDEDEELSRKLSFCIHSYRAVGSSYVSTRSLQRIRRELKENNPKEKEMREDKEDYLQHKLSIQHQMQRLEEKVRDLLSHNKKKKKKKKALTLFSSNTSLVSSRLVSSRAGQAGEVQRLQRALRVGASGAKVALPEPGAGGQDEPPVDRRLPCILTLALASEKPGEGRVEGREGKLGRPRRPGEGQGGQKESRDGRGAGGKHGCRCPAGTGRVGRQQVRRRVHRKRAWPGPRGDQGPRSSSHQEREEEIRPQRAKEASFNDPGPSSEAGRGVSFLRLSQGHLPAATTC